MHENICKTNIVKIMKKRYNNLKYGGMKMKKLLVFDMDGTLLNSQKQISEKTKNAVIEAQKAGIRVACATGRTVSIMHKVFEELKMDVYNGYCIGNNGQELLSLGDNEYTVGDRIPKECVKVCCEVACREDREMYGVVNDVVAFRTSLHSPKFSPQRPANLYDYCREEFETMGEYDKVGYFIAKERNDASALEAELKELLQDKVEVLQTDPGCVELCAKGIDKCYGLDLLCKKYGYQKEDVLVFGDGYNDYKMIKEYPSCAMANAYDEVKKVANYIVASNDEDGVAEGIHKYAY